MPWLIITLLMASVCSAAMGLAWLVGLRRRWGLLLVGTGAGAVSGLLVTVAQGAVSGHLFGSAFGAAVGASVWLVLSRSLRDHGGA